MSEDGEVRLTGPRRDAARAVAEDLLDFLDASPGAWHAVAELTARLEEAGFATLDERDRFPVEHGGKYLLARNGSALVALVAGTAPPSAAGFRMIGAHTDSPGLRLKPNPERKSHGIVHLGVEVYGGPILATWTDRDLGLAGRAVLSDGNGGVTTRLFRTGRPVVSVPNLAIHMNRTANEEGLKLNPQTQLTPILGSLAEGLPEEGAVRELLGRLLDADPASILDFDAFLCDTQKASFAGVNDEFIRSGRLDDLAMCHAASRALAATADAPAEATRVAIFYDNEEVGSLTTQGARSNLVPNLLERIAPGLGDDREGFLAAPARSRLVSADNAHAIHPGYGEKHEPDHAPRLNAGPVVKLHASRAYATDAVGASIFELCCRKAKVPFQRFVNRSDARSGGTIGSMAAAQLGVVTVDVGNPQYAMHSVREMAGTFDAYYMTEAMKAFWS